VLFEDEYSIEIEFQVDEVSIDQDLMVVEHYYKMNCYYYYYLQEIDFDRVVELVLVEM
jgi:hypothetical protein